MRNKFEADMEKNERSFGFAYWEGQSRRTFTADCVWCRHPVFFVFKDKPDKHGFNAVYLPHYAIGKDFECPSSKVEFTASLPKLDGIKYDDIIDALIEGKD